MSGRLRDHEFQISYGPSDDRLHRFYIPALERSVSYDRSAGFFSSSALAVAAAGLLGGYVAGLLTRPISNDIWRLVAMLLLGLLVGLGVGIFVNRAWGRLTKISS